MTAKTSYLPGQPTWVDLSTPDMDRTVAFYTSLLGWTYGGGSEEFGGYGSFFLDGKQVAGVMPLMAPEMPAVWSTYISTDDADKSAALVAENGGQVIAAPMDVGDLGRLAVFADPVGAVIGVWQPKQMTGADVIDEDGAFTWTELSTRDQEASYAFYRSVFGWEPEVTPDYTEFQLGSRSVAGCMDLPADLPSSVPSFWMPYFAVADPAAKAQEAGGLGGTVIVPYLEFPGGRCAIVHDPHGSAFGLLHLT